MKEDINRFADGLPMRERVYALTLDTPTADYDYIYAGLFVSEVVAQEYFNVLVDRFKAWLSRDVKKGNTYPSPDAYLSARDNSFDEVERMLFPECREQIENLMDDISYSVENNLYSYEEGVDEFRKSFDIQDLKWWVVTKWTGREDIHR